VLEAHRDVRRHTSSCSVRKEALGVSDIPTCQLRSRGVGKTRTTTSASIAPAHPIQEQPQIVKESKKPPTGSAGGSGKPTDGRCTLS